jgi:hypothetical protein
VLPISMVLIREAISDPSRQSRSLASVPEVVRSACSAANRSVGVSTFDWRLGVQDQSAGLRWHDLRDITEVGGRQRSASIAYLDRPTQGVVLAQDQFGDIRGYLLGGSGNHGRRLQHDPNKSICIGPRIAAINFANSLEIAAETHDSMIIERHSLVSKRNRLTNTDH